MRRKIFPGRPVPMGLMPVRLLPFVLLLIVLHLLALPAGLAPVARGEFASGEYQFFQELTVTAADTYHIELNGEVLNACRNDLGDIRLADSQGREMPYYLELYQGPPDMLTEGKILEDFSPYADRREILVDSQDDHLNHNGLLVTVAAGREMHGDMLLEGSYDRSEYKALAMHRIYSREGQEYTNELLYPIKKYRYLRLIINSDDAAELSLPRVQFMYRPLHEPSLLLTSTMLLNSYTGSGTGSVTGSSNHILDLGVKNLSVHNILIDTPATSYTRLVNVYDGNDGENWRLLKQEARIFDHRWDSYSARNDCVEINASAMRFLRVEILDGDKPALEVTGIDVLGMAPRLTVSLPAGSYRLYFGNPGAAPPAYQGQPLEPSPQAAVHPVLQAGQKQVNPNYVVPAGSIPAASSNRLVNFVLLACFLAVAAILVRNILKARRR